MTSIDPVAMFDRNPQLTRDYERGPRWFIPGYDVSHGLAAVILRDRLGERGRILVLGAGGGVELSVFARECEGWQFVGIDPSAEMLRGAQAKVDALDLQSRVVLQQGYIEDAPHEPFDAATALLVLHFVPDDDKRLAALREVHARLAPGATFLMINGCADTTSPLLEEQLRLYAANARRNGAPDDIVAGAVRMQRENVGFVPPAREESLLAEAGFVDVRLFYVGLWIYGWVARAGARPS